MTKSTTRLLTWVSVIALIGSLILVALIGFPALQDALNIPGQSVVYVQPTPTVANPTSQPVAPADTDSPATLTQQVAMITSAPVNATQVGAVASPTSLPATATQAVAATPPPVTGLPAPNTAVSAPLRACDTTQFPELGEDDREFFDNVNGNTDGRSNAETQFRMEFSGSVGAQALLLAIDGRYQSQPTPGTPSFGLTASIRIDQGGVTAGTAQIDARLVENMIYFRVNLPDGLIPWYGISYSDLVSSGADVDNVPELETLFDIFDPNTTADGSSAFLDPYQFIYTTRRPDRGDTALFDSCVDLQHILTTPDVARLISLALQQQGDLPADQSLTPDQIAQLLSASAPELSLTVTHSVSTVSEQVEQVNIDGNIRLTGVIPTENGPPIDATYTLRGEFIPATYDSPDLIAAPPIEQTFIIEDINQLNNSLPAN